MNAVYAVYLHYKQFLYSIDSRLISHIAVVCLLGYNVEFLQRMKHSDQFII